MFGGFLSSSGFMPHIHCYLGRPALVWTMFASDLVIGAAYFGISLTLWALLRKIRVSFSLIVLCFGVFIGACGLTHILSVWTLWHPDYWVEAVVKVITAVASLGSCVYLFRLRQPIVQVAESAKLSEEERSALRAFFDLSASGAGMVDARTRRFLRVNRKLCEITGYTRDELLSRTFGELTHPEDRQREERIFTEVCERRSNDWTIEKRYLTKQGTIVWAQVTGTVIRDEAGQATYAMATVQDITERKKVEDALRRSEEEFRTLANAIPQLAWMTNADGYIAWCNQNWYDYTGTTVEQMRAWGWKAVHHPDHSERVTEKWLRHLQTGEPWEDTFPLKSRTGEWRWFLSRARPARDESGRILHWFGTNTDITEQLQAIQARDEFLSIASHELRTPLTGMRIQTQMFERLIARREFSRLTPEKTLQFVHQVEKGIVRLLRLVEDMLDVSRIQTGRLSLNPEPADLAELVKEMTERLKPELTQAGIEVHLELETGVSARIDRLRIEQVLANLLTNAIRYASHAPLEISLARREAAAILSFQDHGPGIDPADLERVFQRFERLVSSKEISGFGLGLYVSKHIVEGHGGAIRVESEKGAGARFVIELPLSSA